jgi:hypothetical protein
MWTSITGSEGAFGRTTKSFIKPWVSCAATLAFMLLKWQQRTDTMLTAISPPSFRKPTSNRRPNLTERVLYRIPRPTTQ